MKLHSVYARFYRSLNYDFVRASSNEYVADPWDATEDGDYPFVRVRLKSDITTVVGANESGKTQVLRAIRAALTGAGFDRSDFCRYSRFFGVSKTLVNPEFGVSFKEVSSDDVKIIERATDQRDLGPVERVAIFRMNAAPMHRLYVRRDGEWSGPAHVKSPTLLGSLGVPVPFTIDADVPLPETVPLAYLVEGKPVAALGRDILRQVWDRLRENPSWFADTAGVTTNAKVISDTFRGVRSATDDELAAFNLASNLLIDVTGLDRSLFAELQKAVRTKNGYASSIVDTINAELATSLDFPHWWSQDSRFELFVALFEYDLVFMIRDRTGRTYGFDERSDGLRYFLSYFVQYLAHRPVSPGVAEILLMDEPDRFLSSSGQQDLLRVFEDFAYPKNSSRAGVQVVYVTHSPFLIDKNEADRIRVLEKGEHDEGTRVVTSSAANHYEPLRSAFGSFVAETTFIGNCNLVVEGPSDQVLIAGMSRWLGSRGVSVRNRLDLNTITIVPAGGTRHIPYLVYLARGRDVEKPPVVVLLDSDAPGDQARADLQAGGAYGAPLLKDELVLQLSDSEVAGLSTDNPFGIAGIEDIVPLEISIAAANVYCQEFVPGIDVSSLNLTVATVFEDYKSTSDDGSRQTRQPPFNRGLLKYLQLAIASAASKPTFHLDKVAFARAVVDVLSGSEGATVSKDSVDRAAVNFELLMSVLARKKRDAERAEATERISSRINRIKRDFVRTRGKGAQRQDVLALVEEISSQLDASPESQQVRVELLGWESRFGLGGEPRGQVDDLPAVLRAIEDLAYRAVRDSSAQ